jgi:citrate lyase subunit beta / citryl-CoA lyase
MPIELASITFPLFVPGDRPDRIVKALQIASDAVIIDLEDAVANTSKNAARRSLVEARDAIASAPCAVMVRINAAGTQEHLDDLGAVVGLALAAVVLPKAETAAAVTATVEAAGIPVLALVESARGVASARALAHASVRLAFGSIDYAADIGCAHTREALLTARAEVVLASRLAGKPAPFDGVTISTRDAALVQSDAAYAAELGFGGKLIIHPAQLTPAAQGFCPDDEQVEWARRVLANSGHGGASQIDGAMIDAPVIIRATQIVQRWERFQKMMA